MKKIILLSFILTLLFLPKGVFAEDDELKSIRLKTNFNIWNVNLNRADLTNDYTKMFWNGMEVKLSDSLDKSIASQIPHYTKNTTVKGIDFFKVKNYLEKKIAPTINQEKQDVTIDIDKDGKIKFEGFAMSGQEIDYEKAFFVIKKAYAKKESDVRLPIKEIKPVVTVSNEELKNKGITSLISTGETNFAGSPRNRRNNIRVGLDKFNGQLIAPNDESGAGKILGRVDGSTGYLKELVIKGNKTIPEYGGGLCQVSTTVYRSLLFAGLPITQRRNHSYAVSYYDPQGLDATIYPPSVDLKFKNDTEGYILLQTTTVGNKAYSNVYGTPVDRHIDLIGPYYYSYRNVPPAKTEYTTELPPGKRQIVGSAHKGFKASWYRRISYVDQEKKDVLEHIFSNYEARPNYTLIGKKTETNEASDNGT